MVSIIIASTNPVLLTDVSANIAQTIGEEFEIIAINNSDGKLGLCELYNRGAAQAKYHFFCFMHEDLLIKTANWGSVVLRLFREHQRLGLIGIAGGQYKSAAPSSWYCYEEEAPELLSFKVVQRYKYINRETQLIHNNPTNVSFVNVASVDGVWFCCTKAAFLSYPFDEKMLKGFHGYDLDFSLGIGQHFEVGVTFDVLLEHFSEGYTDKNWLAAILKVHEKWSAILPVDKANLPLSKILLLEKRGFRSIMGRMRTEGFTFASIKSMLLQGRKSRVMTNSLFIKLYLKLFKLFLKKA